MKLTKNSKILSISHQDLDGTVCQILLSNIFKDITYVSTQFYLVDDILENKVNYDKYDFVFVTDIHPKNEENLYISDNVILIDHHGSVSNYHKPEKLKFVYDKKCGAYYTQKFLEKYFNIDLKEYDELVKYTNDYDLWIHKHKKSKQLNLLYGKYRPQRFRRIFSSGRTEFTEQEKQYIKYKENDIQKTIDNVQVFPSDYDKICMIKTTKYINEVCDYLLRKKKYEIVISINDKFSVSLRTRRTDIDLGKILQECNFGGGHPQAAGFKANNMRDFMNKVNFLMEFFTI